MADPLTLLRQFNNSKKEISERDEQIIFENVSFLKGAKTNYVICRTTPKEYYTLEALLFLLKNVHLSHPIYVQKAGAAKVPVVRFPDRKDLLAFLNGEKETTASIDRSAPLELPLQKSLASHGLKRLNDDSMGEGGKRAKTDESGVIRPDIQEWLAAKLQEKKEGAVTADDLKKGGSSGLNMVMSIEKIAEIKRKIMTRKRGTIKGDDELEAGGIVPEQATFVDNEADVTREIMNRERLLRTRTSVLQSSGKQFLKSILAILQSVKAQEEGKGGQNSSQKQPQSTQPTSQASTSSQITQETTKKTGPSVSYNRYDQERFDSQKETEGFKIDTAATFHGLSLQSVKEGKSQRRAMPSPSPHSQPRARPVSSAKPPGMQKRESKTPIIIVPAGLTALISVLNAKDLLQDFKFCSSQDKKTQGVSRESEVLVHRKKEVVINNQAQTVSVPYRVTDQPLKLQSNDWNRVVAVFVQGPAWQFKGWPNILPDGSPVDIFTKVRAFYMKFDDMKIDPNVNKWDVCVLTINRNRRHVDRACVLRFWEILDRIYILLQAHKSITLEKTVQEFMNSS